MTPHHRRRLRHQAALISVGIGDVPLHESYAADIEAQIPLRVQGAEVIQLRKLYNSSVPGKCLSKASPFWKSSIGAPDQL
jgi:hypothetical protein